MHPEMHRYMIEVQHLVRSPQALQTSPLRDRLEATMRSQAHETTGFRWPTEEGAMP